MLCLFLCSKFNQTHAKPDECIAHVSALTDKVESGERASQSSSFTSHRSKFNQTHAKPTSALHASVHSLIRRPNSSFTFALPFSCSKFNQTHAKPHECIARISAVSNWKADSIHSLFLLFFCSKVNQTHAKPDTCITSELSLIGRQFEFVHFFICLILCSKFNQTHAKPDECIARISAVTDWEAGGRTEPHHLQVCECGKKVQLSFLVQVMILTQQGLDRVFWFFRWFGAGQSPTICRCGFD